MDVTPTGSDIMLIDQIKDEFATDEFISDNKYFYDRYIGYRIHGFSQHIAFNRAFGPEHMPDSAGQAFKRFEQMESTSYFQSEFERRLKAIPVDQLWNDRMSVHELLQLVRNPAHKDSTRLSAVKELNVIVGITVESETGKTKAVRALSDFYKNETQAPKPLPGSPTDATDADRTPAPAENIQQDTGATTNQQ